jgi:hypothetical protein
LNDGSPLGFIEVEGEDVGSNVISAQTPHDPQVPSLMQLASVFESKTQSFIRSNASTLKAAIS